MDKTVTLKITGNSQGLRGEVTAIQRDLGRMGTEGRKAGAELAGGMDAASTKASSLRSVLGLVRSQLAGVAAVAATAFGLRGIREMADGYANIGNRLKLVTSGETALAAARERTFAIAQATNTEYASTATLYSRLIKSARDLGQSQQEQASTANTLATAINQSFQVSGTSAANANAAVLQLSQGLAAGVLRGDEFNSVMENSPRLAQALADGLNVPIGKLREMAEAGELTSETVVRALSGQAAVIAAEFAALDLTIERSWTNLENAVMRYVGQADAANGTSRSIAQGISTIADNIGPIFDSLALVAQAIVFTYGGKALQAISAYISKQAAAAAQQAIGAGIEREMAQAVLATAQARAVELTASAAVIESARAELVTKQALVRAEVESAQAILRATEATQFMSGSLHVRREATERLVVAQAQLNAISNEFASLSRHQAVLTTNLGGAADDLRNAQERVNATMTTGQMVMAKLSSIGSSLFAMIGGWPTVILAAVYASYKLWESFSSGGERMANAVEAANQVIESNERALARMQAQLRGVDDSMIDTIVSFVELGEAAKASEVQLANASTVLERYGAQLQQLGPVGQGVYAALAFQAGQATNAIEAHNEAQQQLLDASLRTAAATDQLAASRGKESAALATAVDAYIRSGATFDTVYATLQKLGLEAQYLNSIWRDAPKAVGEAAQGYSESTEKFLASAYERIETLGKTEEEIIRLRAAEASLAAANDAERIAIDRAAAAQIKSVRAMEAKRDATRDAESASTDLANAIKALRQEEEALQRQRDDELFRSDEALNDMRAMVAALNDEAAQVGMTEAQRRRLALTREFDAKMADAQIANSPALLASLRAEYEAALANVEVKEQAALEMEDLGRAGEESARRSMDAWDQFTGSLAQAVLDGSQGVKRWWKQLIDDMKRQLIQSGLLKIFGSIFNTGGARAGTSLLGSLFSGGATASNGSGLFGTLGDTFSGWLSSNASTIIPGIAAVAGAAYGFGNRGSSNGSGGSMAAGAAYGYAGYALGTVGVGAYLGATAGAATGVAGAATSGALSGAAGAAGAIPVVGWIVAAIAAIDAITGGKVFGSRYRPESSTSSISIGADGGDASMSLTEVRNRSLFRGRQWRTTSQDPGDDARAAAQSLYDSVSDAMTGAAQALAIDVPPVIDAAIRTVTEYDKKGKVKASQIFVDILGRSFKEADAESAATRIIAEGLIATVDAAAQAMAAEVPSLAKPITEVMAKVFDAGIDDFDRGGRGGGGGGNAPGEAASTLSEVQQLAERWRDDAATLMEGAQFLLGAMQAMKADGGLLGLGHSLTETTDLVEELVRGEETLSQTFARLMASTTMLREAVGLMGVSMDTTGADFVKLAQDIVDAAGGLEQAQALWATYFDTFYTLQERTSGALDDLMAQRTKELADVGLGPDITNQQFREAFETALPSLTPEQVVEWLQAGAAIRAASDAQTAYNDALAQAEQPMRDYEAAVRAVAEEAMSGSLTDYQREIRAINTARDEEVARLNELARAAGMQAAAEDDLAAIHVIAARKAAEALAKLRQYGRDLVQQFNGGSQLDLLNEQIAAIEANSSSMYQSQVDGLGAIDDAARSTYEAQLAAQQRIREFLDNLMLGPLGGLRPRGQLAEGQRQFDALMERALGGDAEAMAALPQLADQLLRIGQQVFASGDPYFSLRDSIMAALEQVAAMPATAPTGVPGGTGGGSVQVDASSDLQALYEERDRLLAEQTAAERLALAQDISAVIRDLIIATGAPLETIAADLNVNMADLVSALGVNLEEMTAANANALGDIAASMGVNLTELAANVGVDLGALGDRQSLLNDALEAQLDELPQAQRDQLAPLLRAVEDAAALGDTAGVEDGVTALETAVNALAPNLRDQLAPYFEGVAPVDYTQLDALSFIDAQTASAATSLTAHTGLLERIANNLRESNTAAGLPAYATGTTYVPRTGPALIHEGEMILPAPVARFLRQPQGSGGASNAALESMRAEIRALREDNAKLMQLVATKLGVVASSFESGSNKQANAIDRQTEAIKARR